MKASPQKLCLLSLFFAGGALDGLFLRPYRDERQEEWTVMTMHTGVASHNLEEEEPTQFLPQTLRLGGIYFVIAAAIRTGVQPNSAHAGTSALPILRFERDRGHQVLAK